MDVRYIEIPHRRDPKRGRRKVFVLILLCGAILAILLAMFLCSRTPGGAEGMRLLPTEALAADDMRSLLDESTRKSVMTVSLRPHPPLDETSGALGINFKVDPDNNGLSERFEIEQNGEIIFESVIVEPGHGLEEIYVPKAALGPAVATVYGVDKEGGDHGNPVSVEIEIVEG